MTAPPLYLPSEYELRALSYRELVALPITLLRTLAEAAYRSGRAGARTVNAELGPIRRKPKRKDKRKDSPTLVTP